jgi:hypothetical protein
MLSGPASLIDYWSLPQWLRRRFPTMIGPKVFGVGMSKTGTTTLGQCFELLGLTPTIDFVQELKDLVRGDWPSDPVNRKFEYDPKNVLLSHQAKKRIISVANRYRSFQDSPWYMLFKELDEAFPGSKFILTLRKDAETQAISDWYFNVKKGACSGTPPAWYIQKQADCYEKHNQAVFEYFAGREKDLLPVCFENGDGWEHLCCFLGVQQPKSPFPHANRGQYAK